jgi:eukaryotic-like serine/threonine-protein kinase
MIGSTLNKRYFIVSLLGTGEYGKTYLAEDRQNPKNPRCVIKEFEPKAKDTISLRKAKYLLAREAKILKILGHSDRIPELLAYFQAGNKFYLVHQLIEGTDLTQELGSGKQWTAEQVVGLLREILEIVEVAHQEKVIHQDIKPSNIIRRKSDGKLMLIDFGSVKKLHNQMANAEGKTELTVPIGTEGYMSPEQKSIKPRLASDIYGVGMIGILALTGVEPKNIPWDYDTEIVQWKGLAQVDEKLSRVLDRMIFPDFRQRYTSATEALKVVRNLKLSKKLKLLDFKTIIGAGVFLLGISGAGYYYWQLESSLSKMPDASGYYETEPEQFPFIFRNAKYGIEMKYPFDWKLSEPKQSERAIAQFVPEKSQSDLIPPKVQIEVTPSNNTLLEQYTTDAVYQITKLPQVKIIDSRPIKFARGDGHKIIYTAVNPENNIELQYLQIWTIKGDRIYTIIYQANLEQYDNFAAIVENEMLESLKITPTS